MQAAVQAGEMLPERYELEMQKATKMMEQQLAVAEQQMVSDLQAEISQIENKVVSEKEFKILAKDPTFANPFNILFNTSSGILSSSHHSICKCYTI